MWLGAQALRRRCLRRPPSGLGQGVDPAPRVEIEIVKRINAGFKILPKRWVVERTFAWLARYRRLAKTMNEKPSIPRPPLTLLPANHACQGCKIEPSNHFLDTLEDRRRLFDTGGPARCVFEEGVWSLAPPYSSESLEDSLGRYAGLVRYESGQVVWSLRAAPIASEKIPSFHFIAADAKFFAGVVRQQLPALISSGHDGELRDFFALSAPLLLANRWRKRHFPRKSLR